MSDKTIVVIIMLKEDGTIKRVIKDGSVVMSRPSEPHYISETYWPIVSDDDTMHHISVTEVLA